MASTAGTDAVYVMFTAAVGARRKIVAASWSSVWYLLSAFAVISYTGNPVYVVFAAAGSWLGAFGAVTWLGRADVKGPGRQAKTVIRRCRARLCSDAWRRRRHGVRDELAQGLNISRIVIRIVYGRLCDEGAMARSVRH